VHFFPPETPAQREARRIVMTDAGWIIPVPPGWNPESALDYMDRAGIAIQMLSNTPKSVGALRAPNDYAASLVREHPARFGLLSALPTDNPDNALAEIDGSSLTNEYITFVLCRFQTWTAD
jgi:hypothetical protein